MGWGVAQDMTYPAQLERLLNARPPKGFPADLHYEVLNLGVGNYNTVQEVMRLRNLGLSLDPDLIILGYFINDAEPTPKPSHGFLIEHSYLFAFLVSRMRLLKPATGSYLDYYRGLYADQGPGWQAAQAALRDLASISRERSIPAVVFIIPEMHDLATIIRLPQSIAGSRRRGMAMGLPAVDLLDLSGRSKIASRSRTCGSLLSIHTTMPRRSVSWRKAFTRRWRLAPEICTPAAPCRNRGRAARRAVSGMRRNE